MSTTTAEVKTHIQEIITRAEAPIKKYVIHYLLWARGILDYPGTKGTSASVFNKACDELLVAGDMTARSTARGTVLAKTLSTTIQA